MRPFQPGPLHQRRRPRGDPGGHRDAAAAAQVPRAGPDLPEPLDEPFLPGKAQADQDQVGSGGGDGGDRPPRPFVRAVKAERGRVGACDPQAGKPRAQGGGRLVRHARGAAEQIDRPVVGGGRGAQREHQRGAGHPLRQRLPADPGRPDQGHAVGDDQGPRGHEVGQLGLPGHGPGHVHVHRDDRSAAPGRPRGPDGADDFPFGQGVEPEITGPDPGLARCFHGPTVQRAGPAGRRQLGISPSQRARRSSQARKCSSSDARSGAGRAERGRALCRSNAG